MSRQELYRSQNPWHGNISKEMAYRIWATQCNWGNTASQWQRWWRQRGQMRKRERWPAHSVADEYGNWAWDFGWGCVFGAQQYERTGNRERMNSEHHDTRRSRRRKRRTMKRKRRWQKLRHRMGRAERVDLIHSKQEMDAGKKIRFSFQA